MSQRLILFYLLFNTIFLFIPKSYSQVKVKEYSESFKTYDFGDPNPTPIFLSNTKIYPYFSFDGYSTSPSQKNYKIIEIENDFIKVFIAPEIGGKVLGAIDKTSGKDFIYKNEVVKFRNISMRGPWTSGGIEFNFGIIGHHPSTATPVDYLIKKNKDGSISCFVGNIDLPSRTQWRVEIILHENQASFMTNALWYNPTSINQSYYNWMTAAAPAKNDLEFYTPGNKYLEHNGNSNSWPIDYQGRDLSKYKNNNFGPNKSYHIVGEYNDFFGGYYKKDDYGFGHWGEYEEIPGQKLWLWSQSREGGIWEDLLTDDNGQYIEYQAGRLFVQYSPENKQNPISNVNFEPYSTDNWSEAWFPLKGIGGLSDASKYGALNVIRDKDSITIKINPFIKTTSTLKVFIDNNLFYSNQFNSEPMDIIVDKIKLNRSNQFSINIGELDLQFSSDNSSKIIERSFENIHNEKDYSDNKILQIAKENIFYREYEEAKKSLISLIEKDQYNLEAIYHLSELYYRSGNFDKSIDILKIGLNVDTYNSSLNYILGIVNKDLGNFLNSKEALGWAARSIKYRSNAYSQIADIFLIEKNYKKALEYAEKSLEFNVKNIPSLEIKAIANRYLNDTLNHRKAIQKIYDIDPINHIISYENYIINSEYQNIDNIKKSHRSELAHQTYLELAIRYYNRGLKDDAIKILEIGPNNMVNKIWSAYLRDDVNIIKQELPKHKIDFQFPHRRETIKVLEWAKSELKNWKINYLLALNLYHKGRYEDAIDLLNKIGDEPENSIFYLNRGLIFEMNGINPMKDFEKAYEIDNKNWRISKSLSDINFKSLNYISSYNILKDCYKNNKSNYIIGMDYVKVLLKLEKFKEAVNILNEIQILPYEHAGEGRELYAEAYRRLALKEINNKKFISAINLLNDSKKWPENLGVGKPYDPEERIEDYLLFYCYKRLGEPSPKNYLSKIVDYTEKNIDKNKIENILGYLAIKNKEGRIPAEKFLARLNDIHGNNSTTMKFIYDFEKNKVADDRHHYDVINKILNINEY